MRQFVEMETLVSGVFITPSSFKAILCWNIWNLIIVRPCICREIVHEPEADAVSGLIKAHWKSLEGAFSDGMQTLSQSHWSFKLHPHPAWIHTWYLSFFLHEQNFWRIKFTPKKTRKLRQNTQKIANFLRYYSKIHSKLPIFRVKSVKIYTGQKKFTRTCSWGSWQISGMDQSAFRT